MTVKNILIIFFLVFGSWVLKVPNAFAQTATSSAGTSTQPVLSLPIVPREENLGSNSVILLATSSTSTGLSLTTAPIPSVGPGLTLTYKNTKFFVSGQTVDSWKKNQILDLNKIFVPAPPSLSADLLLYAGQSANQENSQKTLNFSLSAIYDYLKIIAPQIAVSAKQPSLQIENNRATDFSPGQTGLEPDLYASAISVENALENKSTSVTIVVIEQAPKTSLSETNNLGINELIGEGVSTFNGSPNNRRHNIAAGLTKFQGEIVRPGETFSFDNSLGPVTADAGFLPELVIDNGNTLPELGGGLCQVSTTTFRAAMAAGLPITARRNHAYAVSYYSPQGTDATIYPGSADLKFVNDTPAAILIWPYEKDSNTLVFDFYGTSDGRQVTLEKPVVYDRQKDGSMKATWTRLVNKNGVIKTDVFNSTYQSPALFHKTEVFVTAAGTQTTSLKMPLTTSQKTVQ